MPTDICYWKHDIEPDRQRCVLFIEHTRWIYPTCEVLTGISVQNPPINPEKTPPPPSRGKAESLKAILQARHVNVHCNRRRYIGNIQIRISYLDYPFRIWSTMLNSLSKLRVRPDVGAHNIQIRILDG